MKVSTLFADFGMYCPDFCREEPELRLFGRQRGRGLEALNHSGRTTICLLKKFCKSFFIF
jgi:hypothetical protein